MSSLDFIAMDADNVPPADRPGRVVGFFDKLGRWCSKDNAGNVIVIATGPQGLPGADGATGPAGPQGLPGADGATGPAGPQGLPGADGATGPAGPQGLPGADGATGPAGPQGLPGADGATGPAGPQGLPGADGATGPAGPQGLPGADGATGPAGPQGLPGADGATGPAGPQGLPGADGATGPAGPQGLPGADGATGPAGPQGATGPQGASGTMPDYLISVDGDGLVWVNGPNGYKVQLSLVASTPSGTVSQLAMVANTDAGADATVNGLTATVKNQTGAHITPTRSSGKRVFGFALVGQATSNMFYAGLSKAPFAKIFNNTFSWTYWSSAGGAIDYPPNWAKLTFTSRPAGNVSTAGDKIYFEVDLAAGTVAISFGAAWSEHKPLPGFVVGADYSPAAYSPQSGSNSVTVRLLDDAELSGMTRQGVKTWAQD